MRGSRTPLAPRRTAPAAGIVACFDARECARPGVDPIEAADEVGPSGARSVLVITSTSASAACRAASAKRSSVAAPCTASTRVTTAAEAQAVVEHRIRAEREEDRRRVGEAASSR